MIGVNYRILQDYGSEGIEEAYNVFIQDNDLKKLVSEDFIVNYMTDYLKSKYKVKGNEDLNYLGKSNSNGRFVFEILGKKSTADNIRRHEVLYVDFEPCVEVNNGSRKMYMRLNTADLEDYINPFIVD